MLKIFSQSLIFRLFIAVIAGILIGQQLNIQFMGVMLSLQHIIGQLIFFMVPLVIFACIAPAINQMKNNANKMLVSMLALAYFSSIGAALLAGFSGYTIIPQLNIVSSVDQLQELPPLLFKLDIPPLFSVMSALTLALCVGLASVWSKTEQISSLLQELNLLILNIVNRIIIPILPIFIACTFAVLSYEGSITKHFPVFLSVIAIVIVGQFIWLSLLYSIAGIVSGINPWRLIKHYLPAYLTAIGTMSSAATLPVALKSAKSAKVLDEDVANFAIPMGATVHLCGSVLTEVFFVMTVSQILYGTLPDISTLLLFIFLLGIFAIGAPGVPGGTVMASLGLITSILGFDETGIALMLTIFALQDSFGTACNVTGDGALALILQGIFKK